MGVENIGLADRGVHALGAIVRIGDMVSNDLNCRHTVRNAKRAASKILEDAFMQVEYLESLAKNVVSEELEKKAKP